MDWLARVRAAFDGAQPYPDEDVIEELAQHAQAIYQSARADGLSDEAADQRVAGLLHKWRHEAPALRRRPGRVSVEPPPTVPASRFDGLMQDLRFAVRLLRREPRHALLVVLTTALGIGATTVLFSVTYGVLMRPLPWPNGDRIVVLSETRGGRAPRFGSFSNAEFYAWRDGAQTIDQLAAWSLQTMTLEGAGDPERIRVASASASLFTVLGVRPHVGALFSDAEETSDVVVLSESLWRQRFSADAGAVGRLVRLDGKSRRIVGVLPDALAYPNQRTQAWVPMRVPRAQANLLSMFSALATLKPGVTAAQAAVEGTTRGLSAPDSGLTTTAIFGGSGPIEIAAAPLRDTLTNGVRRPLIVLLIGVGLLLVTSTANVASLQLARATARRREMAIRVAIGAGGGRLTRQVLVENLLLGMAGGGAGILLAWWLHGSVPVLLPTDFPRVDDVRFDFTVMGLAVAVSLLTSLVFGWLPAWRARSQDVLHSLTEDGRSSVGVTGRSATARARALIMIGQVAISCVLLVGSSLLGRSFVSLLNVDRGYDPSGVLTARVSLSAHTPERRFAIAGDLLARVNAIRGITSAGFTSESPLTSGGSTAAFTMQTRAAGTISVQASPRLVSAGAIPALGMHLVAGRNFTDADTETSEPVAVVNRAFARTYLDDNALDAEIPMGAGYQDPSARARVVGVVNSIRYVMNGDSSLPEVYYVYRQMSGRVTVPGVTLFLRTASDPGAFAAALRSAVRETDPSLVAEGVTRLDDRVLGGLARPRLYAVVLAGFAVFSLVVSSVGLFGVLSYSVAQRRRELAVRAALGARGIDIARLVLRQGVTMTAAGLGVGLAASFVLTPFVGSLLFGITAHDAVTYVLVSVTLTVIAALACSGPARRAARLDTLRELRS